MKSEVYYSRNILIVEKTHDKKKEEEKPKLSGEKNVSRQRFCLRKNAKGHIFRQNVPKGHIFALFATFISSSLRKLLLLHNLTRINTHDKFTLEDAVITEMIGSKLRIFFKSRDARYRSLARVV